MYRRERRIFVRAENVWKCLHSIWVCPVLCFHIFSLFYKNRAPGGGIRIQFHVMSVSSGCGIREMCRYRQIGDNHSCLALIVSRLVAASGFSLWLILLLADELTELKFLIGCSTILFSFGDLGLKILTSYPPAAVNLMKHFFWLRVVCSVQGLV